MKNNNKNTKRQKPELLLPTGNIEAFYAAIEGGADAIYLGLSSFNARNRAKNFTVWQLQKMLVHAHRKHVKIYVTINTLIKDKEIPELLNYLHLLNQMKIDAVIIQDWGVYYIIKKYFRNLEVHASTQMGTHNSIGAEFLEQKGFARCILARELTKTEISEIKSRTNIELEIFVHGALCYSFSGYCLFSSFLGGMSANRGQCRQPCRRIFKSEDGETYLFSLKDFDLIEYVDFINKNNISSLKIEGRMKPAEYVYNTAKAYRIAIDSNTNKESKKLIAEDLAREKTEYFFGEKIEKEFTESPYTGMHVGEVTDKTDESIFIKALHTLNLHDRIRILRSDGHDSTSFKINEMKIDGKIVDSAPESTIVEITTDSSQINIGEKVFLVGFGHLKFKNKFPKMDTKFLPKLKKQEQDKILKSLTNRQIGKSKQKEELFIRIDKPEWLRKIFLQSVDKVIINLEDSNWMDFNFKTKFLLANKHQFIFELPKFIIEKRVPIYRKLAFSLFQAGFSEFMISHLSQILLIPKSNRVRISTNENVYIHNDAAFLQMKSENISNYVLPYESDFETWFSLQDRSGIVPLFFHPQLFYSRMPIGLKPESQFSDDKINYISKVRNGFTIVIPENPISIMQQRSKLEKHQYHKFLIDLSFIDPSKNKFNALLKHFQQKTNYPGSGTFNFKQGMW